MVSNDSRVILLLACQREVHDAKCKYREGKISRESLRAVYRAMEGIQTQIQIEHQKGNNETAA
jgi:hypothetical protein